MQSATTPSAVLPAPPASPSAAPLTPLRASDALSAQPSALPSARKPSNHLDIVGIEAPGHGKSTLAERETVILEHIAARIQEGRFELPQLPATSVAVLNMTSRSTAEIKDIVHLIESDPVLTSELIKTANSALYAGAEPADTIAQSIMRIGMRNLRTLMFSVSLRSVVLRDKRFARYGEEVWRQSYSMASIARAIAKPIGVEPDRAFLLGLLADIGKVSLLSMLRRELQRDSDVSPALVGRIFHVFHEQAGAAMAVAWHLPEDITSVVRCHHRFEENAHSPRDSALISLASRLDVLMSMDDEDEYRNAVHAPELEYLGVASENRWAVLEAARGAYTTTAPTA